MGWSDGAMVLGKLPVPGRPTIWMIVGQGSIALAVGAGGGCLDIFTLYPFSPLSSSLWETARYCLKGPLSPKQPTNQPLLINKYMWNDVRFKNRCGNEDRMKFNSDVLWVLVVEISMDSLLNVAEST